jgi:hypothetical protein
MGRHHVCTVLLRVLSMQTGDLLACLDLGFQITCLALHPLGAAAGGAQGEMQIAVILPGKEEDIPGEGAHAWCI